MSDPARPLFAPLLMSWVAALFALAKTYCLWTLTICAWSLLGWWTC